VVGSGDSFVNCCLSCFRQQFIWCLLLAIYYCRLFLLKVPMESSFLLFPLLWPAQSTPPLCCMSFSVPCLLFRFFFLFWGSRAQSVQGAMLVYPRGGCGSTMCHLFAHLLVCISQADFDLVSCSVGALLVSQCNVVWRSFVQVGGLRCWSFASSWWYFSAKCGASISARFFIYGAHTACFLPVVTILDPSLFLFF
jgi:hypothetical protein